MTKKNDSKFKPTIKCYMFRYKRKYCTYWQCVSLNIKLEMVLKCLEGLIWPTIFKTTAVESDSIYRIYLTRIEVQVSISYKQFLTWHLYECYMGVCLLQSTEPQCLFEPSCLYEPCFYLDKYGMLLSFEWVDLSHQNRSDQTDFGRKFAKIGSPGPLLLPKLVWLHQFWQPKLVPLANGPYSLPVCTSYFIFCSIHV